MMKQTGFLGLGVSAILAVVMPLAALAPLGACGSDDAPSGNGGHGDGTNDGSSPPAVRAEFGLDSRPTNTTCKPAARPPSTAPVKLEQVYANVALQAPMMMAQIPGDSSRWFVALRGTTNGGNATVVSFPADNPPNAPNVVATIGPVQSVTDGEGGLLGMAFHPRFAQNGRLYVSYLTTGGANNRRSMVGYLTSTDNGKSFGNFQPILSFDQTTATNHKGGGIAFGKDGYLYLGFGDGGGGDDTFKNGQTKTGFFSKLLRIDVDNVPQGQTYGIPDGNPFKNGGGEPAVFAYGFRNPFRFSIDRDSNEIWVGDVGQNVWEEIDAKIKIGANYGWPCREGLHDYMTDKTNPDHCPSMIGLTDPVTEHKHDGSRSITGGVVYRGKAIPDFVGSYIYGDYAKQDIWTLSFDPSTGAVQDTQISDAPAGSWVHFAEDNDGEVYAVSLNDGRVYKVVAAAPTGPNTFPDRLSRTGCVDASDPKKPGAGLVPYGVNSALWSDGAQKERYLALPDGKQITIGQDGDFDFPNGTVLVKTFSLGGKRIETRLFMRHDDGGWAGYTYEWLDDQSDAVLLPSSKSKVVGAQPWTYPSRSDCVSCHSEAAGHSLGLELGQLNGDFTYPSTNRISNQLKTLDHIGLFATALGKPVDELAKYPDPLDDGALEARARSYLHANCSNCHRPDGPGRGNMDLRFASSLADVKACNASPSAGDLGIDGAKLLVPGDPAKSLISVRPHSPGANRMPPIASSVVDDKGMAVVDDWIKSLTQCP
ncbi:PQQ-dependent sugar dehydrogenase [Labilithrix luteola]|nr:PQQ-dependent sugar dehydrogenase [Labilithrix luteola]